MRLSSNHLNCGRCALRRLDELAANAPRKPWGYYCAICRKAKPKLAEAQRITHVGYGEWDLLTNRVS
jgi:hypothetical protein